MSISILPLQLQLVSVPKSALDTCTHAILRNVFFPANDQQLFSFTETELEVTIIADVATVERDFAGNPKCEIQPDKFKALILGDEEGMENSGKRINDISYMLTRVGISIYYLSTYQEDITLVKEKYMPLVLTTLCSQFCFIELGQQENVTPPPLSPTASGHPTEHSGRDEDDEDHEIDDVADLPGAAQTTRFNTRSLAEVTGSTPTQPAQYIMLDGRPWATSPFDSPVIFTGAMEHSPNENPFFTQSFMDAINAARKEKRSEDLMAEVQRLCPKQITEHRLQMVGLNREYIERLSTILMKTLFFPDLVDDNKNPNGQLGFRFLSYTATAEGISLITDQSILSKFPEHMLNRSSDPTSLRCIHVDISRFGLDKYGVTYSISNPLIKNGINLLYLSTLRTANVLVQDDDLTKSFRILEENGNLDCKMCWS